MSAPLLRLEHASFGYGGRPVLRGVSLAVSPGERLAVLGDNGSGKSTLLRGLLGLLPPLAGKVLRSPELGDAVGWVPQEERLDLLFPMTALDVARLGRALAKPWHAPLDAGDEREALAALESVGLLRERDAPFAELSGGQRQRALLARALAARPRLLVLDEPTSAVDARSEAAVAALLERLPGESGLAVIVVTHRQTLLAGRGVRAFTLEDGRLREGRP